MKIVISCLQTMEKKMEYTLWGQKMASKKEIAKAQTKINN
jgi:hypothetical protein